MRLGNTRGKSVVPHPGYYMGRLMAGEKANRRGNYGLHDAETKGRH